MALTRAGITFTTHTYTHDDAAESYGLEAAAALGLEPATVFKTLVAQTDHGPVVGIVPVTGHLDLKALAAAAGAKRAVMADPHDAERLTGYVVGGISPIGQRRRLRTVLDASALDHPQIYVSGGRRGFDVGLAPADLVAHLDATVAPVAATRGGDGGS